MFALLVKMTEIGSQTSSTALVLCAEICQVIQDLLLRSRSCRICQNEPKRAPATFQKSGLKSRPSALIGDFLKGARPADGLPRHEAVAERGSMSARLAQTVRQVFALVQFLDMDDDDTNRNTTDNGG